MTHVGPIALFRSYNTSSFRHLKSVFLKKNVQNLFTFMLCLGPGVAAGKRGWQTFVDLRTARGSRQVLSRRILRTFQGRPSHLDRTHGEGRSTRYSGYYQILIVSTALH